MPNVKRPLWLKDEGQHKSYAEVYNLDTKTWGLLSADAKAAFKKQWARVAAAGQLWVPGSNITSTPPTSSDQQLQRLLSTQNELLQTITRLLQQLHNQHARPMQLPQQQMQPATK
jgi:hypothetical protein